MADIKYTMPPPTEDTEQMCLFRWADAQSGKYPELSLMVCKLLGRRNAGHLRQGRVRTRAADHENAVATHEAVRC